MYHYGDIDLWSLHCDVIVMSHIWVSGWCPCTKTSVKPIIFRNILVQTKGVYDVNAVSSKQCEYSWASHFILWKPHSQGIFLKVWSSTFVEFKSLDCEGNVCPNVSKVTWYNYDILRPTRWRQTGMARWSRTHTFGFFVLLYRCF